MSAPLVDHDVRELVGRHGLDQTLFVEAGAGSGKTTLLVQRIVSLVLEAGQSLSSIAAITFTEAAAAELASRVRAKFEQEQLAAREVGDESRAERCRQALVDTDLAAITTLHGFANRILGEFAVAAQLPPHVHVLDEVSSQLAQEDRWQRFVDRLYENPDHADLLQVASALQIPVEPRYADQATMRTVADVFNQNWDRLGPLIDADRAPVGSEFDFTIFDQAVAALDGWLGSNLLTEDKLYVHLNQILPGMHAIAGMTDPLRKVRALTRAPKWTVGRGGSAKHWEGADTVATIKQAIRDVEESKTAVLEPITDAVLRHLGQIIAVEMFETAQLRRSEGGLEFHDLLVLAREVLRSNAEARATLHERFRYILLDEFQDTDPIQIELAVLIATNAAEVADRPWSDLEVEPGRLFFVGDPKQSIYRFRRADIALFLEARDVFVGPDGATQLRANFRTAEPIVEWFNAFFDHQMPEEQAGQQPRYQPLAATRVLDDPEARSQHRPVLLGGPHPEPKVSAAALRTVEAEDVVGTVRAILADPQSWPVFDRRTEAWRPAQLEDITILLPTRTSLPFLRSALEDADVRYRIATGTLVYNTQEVVDALAALRAIDDPGDELSLVTALRSPLYACSDVDLATWRRAGGRWDVRASVPSAVSPDHPVAMALAHLADLWRQRWFLTPSALLERLLRERRATMLAFGDLRPTDVWRRLRFLVEQARAFEEADSGDLRAFVQWASLQGGSMARVHEPLLPETDEAALSIQTIHGSKGLEFPITILSGMTTQMRPTRTGVSVLWPEVGQPSISLTSKMRTTEHGPRADLEAAMDEFEKMRLAYVATTRARDHLVVSCHHKAGRAASTTYGGIFWTAFDDDERRGLARSFDWQEIVGRAGQDVVATNQLGLALDNRGQWIAERNELLAPYVASPVLSATGVAQHALRPAASAPQPEHEGIEQYIAEVLVEQDDDGADQPVDSLLGRRRGRTGSAIGSAVHAVLQLTDLAQPVGTHELVVQQCEVHGIGDRTGIVRRLVEAALQSEAVALAARSVYHQELFVAAPVHKRMVEGYVDLLIETDAGFVVVDYKTDAVRSDEDVDAKLRAYELQAAAYAVALEVSTTQPVVECRFVFCTPTGAIERSVADIDAAKQRVRDTLAALG